MSAAVVSEKFGRRGALFIAAFLYVFAALLNVFSY